MKIKKKYYNKLKKINKKKYNKNYKINNILNNIAIIQKNNM